MHVVKSSLNINLFPDIQNTYARKYYSNTKYSKYFKYP